MTGKKRSRSNPFPMSPAANFLGPWLGPTRKPRTRQARLHDAMDSWLMCGEFRGFENGAEFVRDKLSAWGVEFESAEGSRMLEHYVQQAIRGEYGDFMRFVDCVRCRKEFRPNHSIEYARRVIELGVWCDNCWANRFAHGG